MITRDDERGRHPLTYNSSCASCSKSLRYIRKRSFSGSSRSLDGQSFNLLRRLGDEETPNPDENFVKTDLDYSASSKKIENKDNSGLKLVDGYGCIRESKYWLKIQHNK